MEILYVSCYPEEYFKKVINKSKTLSSQPSQKFNKMFVDGFMQNNVDISVVQTFNHLKWETGHFIISEETIVEEGIKYYFLPLIKARYLNRLYMHFVINNFFKKWKNDHPNGVIVMDLLKPFSNIISKYTKGNILVTIVTDLPEFLLEATNPFEKLKKKLLLYNYNKIIKRSTHFVFLTEQMNIRLNKENRPYCIIEGLVDIKMMNQFETARSDERKICLYSGALYKQFGLINLVDAFTCERLTQYELHLYGTGDYVNEIEEIAKQHNNIKYFGNVENSYVVQKQIEATVLINPRPTDAEFTQFSFPSKNMEYMVSGTPVITTALAGMPNEYRNYVYILEGHSVEDIINCVDEVLSKSTQELKEKGQSARDFVLAYKNNVVQSKKILEMIMKS